MKVWHKNNVGSYSGTIDDTVFRPAKSRLVSYMRKYVIPTANANTALFKSVGENLGVIWRDEVSEGYKANLRTYGQRYFTEHLEDGPWDPMKSSYGFFVKMMYAWQASDPEHVDLAYLTGEDLTALGGAISQVTLAILNNLLPPILNHSDLTAAM